MSVKSKIIELFRLFITFFKIGIITFGGGYAMLANIEREIVHKKEWLSYDSLMNMIAIAESTPGPIAINVATFVGTKRAGILGGLVATIGTILPSFIIIYAITFFIVEFKENPWVNYAFMGIRISVAVLIFNAALKFFKKMKKNVFSILVLIATLSLTLFTPLDVIYIVLGGAFLGIIFYSIKNSFNKRRL